jgi:hypothetical protein
VVEYIDAYLFVSILEWGRFKKMHAVYAILISDGNPIGVMYQHINL